MCPAAIPIDHDRRWRDDFQEEKKKKKHTLSSDRHEHE